MRSLLTGYLPYYQSAEAGVGDKQKGRQPSVMFGIGGEVEDSIVDFHTAYHLQITACGIELRGMLPGNTPLRELGIVIYKRYCLATYCTIHLLAAEGL